MTVPRSYVVTAAADRKYTATLVPSGEGWSVDVQSDGKRWTFSITAGPAEGLAKVDDRPLRWHWDAAAGRLMLNGSEHALMVATEAEYRLPGFLTHSRAAAHAYEIRAPMPGLMLSIEIVEGQSVAAGQGVLVIEAMKMENEITAPAAGLVHGIAVTAGQSVERGALLCRIEPPSEDANAAGERPVA